MKRIMSLLLMVMMFMAACGSEGTYQTIDIEDIPTKVDEGYTVLDVRETSEFDAGHIPGASNKPLSELQQGNLEGLDSKGKYIVICQSGNRSKQASEILEKENIEIVNVSEGMSSWTGEVE